MKTADEAAIENLLTGDKSAFNDLVIRHQMAVMRLCHFVCGEYDTAANLVKRAFLAFANNVVQHRNRGDMHEVLVDHAVAELLAWIKRGSQLISPLSENAKKITAAFFLPAEDIELLENRSLDEIRNYSIRVATVLQKAPPYLKLVAGLKIFENRSMANIAKLTESSPEEAKECMVRFRSFVLGDG